MNEFRCENRLYNNNKKIIGYVLKDSSGKEYKIDSADLKALIKSGKITVTNLRLTNNDRLIKVSTQCNSERLSMWDTLVHRLKVTGDTNKLEVCYDIDGVEYYIIHMNQTDHILYIPDNVVNTVKISNNTIIKNLISDHTKYIDGSLKVIGGRGLNSAAYMFYDSGIWSVDLSGFSFSNIKDIQSMVAMCNKLRYINIRGADTSKVRYMNSLFYCCTSLRQIDLSGIDTSNVEKMDGMFQDCVGLSNLDLRSFDTSMVEDMNGMFCGCMSLSRVDLSSFRTPRLRSMNRMFDQCVALDSVDLSNFNLDSVERMAYMFDGCKSLRSVKFGMVKMTGKNTTKMFNKCPIKWNFKEHRMMSNT